MKDTHDESRSPAPDYENSVAQIETTKKRGRPATGFAMTQAQRDARYRTKKRFFRVIKEALAAGLSPRDLIDDYFRK